MTLMKKGLWNIVNGLEVVPEDRDEYDDGNEARTKFTRGEIKHLPKS